MRASVHGCVGNDRCARRISFRKNSVACPRIRSKCVCRRYPHSLTCHSGHRGARHARSGLSADATSKLMDLMVAEEMARRLGPDNIRVFAVHPGRQISRCITAGSAFLTSIRSLKLVNVHILSDAACLAWAGGVVPGCDASSRLVSSPLNRYQSFDGLSQPLRVSVCPLSHYGLRSHRLAQGDHIPPSLGSNKLCHLARSKLLACASSCLASKLLQFSRISHGLLGLHWDCVEEWGLKEEQGFCYLMTHAHALTCISVKRGRAVQVYLTRFGNITLHVQE